jgi:hypothetical protein
MTTWTEAQIDRHLHLWEHRHGPDSPEAGIVRQLRAERDAARNTLEIISKPMNCYSPHAGLGGSFAGDLRALARAALTTTQETPHE